jgi:hypothetical protein
MTETPSDPSSPGERNSEYGSAPPPAGQQPPAPPPPAAAAPAAQAPVAEPAAQYQAPPAGYQAGHETMPPIGHQEQPPAVPGSFQAAAAGFGQQFTNYDPATLRNFNPREASPLDLGIIAAGIVAFIFSLFKFYKYTVSIAGVGRASETVSAWHGFFGWFGALVALLSALLLAAELIAKIRFPFPTRLVVLGGFALALICELLALLIVPGDTGGLNGAFGVRIDKGHSFGYWITLIAVVVGTALAYKRFDETGGKLPGRR